MNWNLFWAIIIVCAAISVLTIILYAKHKQDESMRRIVSWFNGFVAGMIVMAIIALLVYMVI